MMFMIDTINNIIESKARKFKESFENHMNKFIKRDDYFDLRKYEYTGCTVRDFNDNCYKEFVESIKDMPITIDDIKWLDANLNSRIREFDDFYIPED